MKNNRTSWTAPRAVACALAVIAFSYLSNEALRFADNSSEDFARFVRAYPHPVDAVIRVINLLVWLIAPYLISGSGSSRTFAATAGFGSRPNRIGWLLAWGAVGLAILNLLAIQTGLAAPGSGAVSKRFYESGNIGGLFFILLTTVVSPFVEENLLRGFLYKALRQTFSVITCTMVVLMVTIYFHWKTVAHDFVSAASLILGGVILCAVRERTRNTWNCYLFHAAYNAAITQQWQICAVGLIALIPTCFTKAPPETALPEESSEKATSAQPSSSHVKLKDLPTTN